MLSLNQILFREKEISEQLVAKLPILKEPNYFDAYCELFNHVLMYTHGDREYVTHVLDVLEVFIKNDKLHSRDDVFRVITVIMLHDALEDYDVTEEDLFSDIQAIYSGDVISDDIEDIKVALQLLNNTGEGSYSDYIDKIVFSQNHLALIAKYCDMTANYKRSLKNGSRLLTRYKKHLPWLIKDMEHQGIL